MSGGIWAFIGRFSTSIMTLVINVILAHFLPPSDLGIYFLAFNLAFLGAYMGVLGFEQTTLRYVAHHLAKKMIANVVYTIKFSFLSALVGSIIVGLLYYFSSEWISKNLFQSDGLYSITILLIFWAAANTFQVLLSESYRAFQDIRNASIFGGVLSTAIFFVSFYSCFYFQWLEINLNNVIVIWIGSLLLSNIIGIILLIKKIYSIKQDKDTLVKRTIQSKKLLETAYPFLIVSVSVYILSQADLWIIGMIRGEDEVAIYGNAAKLSIIVSMPLFIVNAVITPMIAEKFAQGRLMKLEKILRFVSALATIPSMGVVILFFFFGGEILTLLFGSFYSGGAFILLLLSIKQLLSVWNGVCGTILAMTGKQKDLMRITLISGVLSVFLAYLLGRFFGGVGVALAFLFIGVLSQMWSWIMVRKSLNIRADADFISTFLRLKRIFKKKIIEKHSY